jgi:cytochrome c oxidase subunit 4
LAFCGFGLDYSLYHCLPCLKGENNLKTEAQTQAIAGHEFEHPNYIAVWVALLVLTVMEVGALYLPFGKLIVVLTLLALSVVKAVLVGMYFMHLKFERWVLIAIITYPLMLSVILTVLTFTSLYRHWF